MALLVRTFLMLLAIGAGYVWLLPRSTAPQTSHVTFVESAAQSGCVNLHTKVQLSDKFANIMPWLASVGAAAAAADYDGDGDADIYATNSGRGVPNRLFRNRGDGTFDEVARDAGVACGNPEGASMHAIWGDVDNDGDNDLYVVKWAEANQLFLNDGNRDAPRFTDVSRDARVDNWAYANGATFLDYDRDGRLDILVGNYFAETVIDPKTNQPVRNNLWNPVTTRVMHETFTHARNGGRNVLYRNVTEDGTVRFDNVTETVGLTRGGWTLAVGSADLNNDGWPDLYVANDFGPDELYLNTGAAENPPRFRLVIDPAGHPGVGNDWWKGMNVDMADVNNDGYLDIYVTNILEKRYKTDEGNMLWINCADAACPGGRGFRNTAKLSGVIDGGWGWGGKFADFNNDGLLDIYTVNGFATGDPKRNYWFAIQEMVTQTKNQTADATVWPDMGDRDLSGRERGRLFIQLPANSDDPHAPPKFAESAEQSGISDTYNGRGIAIADFDLDGDLDMYIANQGAPSTYYRNRTNDDPKRTSAFLRLTLVGLPDQPVAAGDRNFASSTNAVGARVELLTTQRAQVREVQGGMGFASQSEHAIHFGLSNPAAAQRLTIRWPSGRTQSIEQPALHGLMNRHSRLIEGSDPAVQP